MTTVVDSSTFVAALVESESRGAWARAELLDPDPVAPHLLLAEVFHVLRRLELRGELSADACAVARSAAARTPIRLMPFAPYAARVAELRHSVTAYDAWYVALAEAFDAPLATLDARLAAAPGPRCPFLTP